MSLFVIIILGWKTQQQYRGRTKKHTKIFSEYVKEKDMGEQHAEGNIKEDLGKNRTKNVY